MYEQMKELFRYYIDNQEDFVNKYNGKVVVLKDNDVIGVYDNEWLAFEETKKSHEPGSFIVQSVSPGDEAYTVSVASNFVFAGVE